MKALLIIASALIIVGALAYAAVGLKPKADEISTEAEPEINQMKTNNPDDLTVPELEDFDSEIQNLDQSINQL